MMQVPTDQARQAVDSLTQDFGEAWASMFSASDIWFKVGFSLVVVGLLVFVRRILLNVLDRRVEDVHIRYRWAKGTAYGAFVLVVLILTVIWTDDFLSLGTFLGLLTAGLAIALRDLVAALAGWMFIIWRRPFDLGDRIQIGDHAGDVVDLRIFQFTILEIGNWVDADQSTGRIIHIPNQKVFTESQANYTSQFEYLWNEVAVLVTFESDWRAAKEILGEIAEEYASDVAEEAEKAMRRASRKFLIFYQKLTPVVYTTVKDSGVMLTLRYLCKPRQRRGNDERIWEAVLERFGARDDIDLAYPTRRLYYNQLEGKDAARAPLPPALGSAGPERPEREE